jgi:endonuclease/exonuclease/phosphatase family metal-dependent hydrolase
MTNRFAVCAVFTALAMGCAEKKDEPRAPTCDDRKADLVAVTYNVGLGPGIVPLATPRTAPAAAAIALLDADVLCLQEVWLPSAKEAVAAGLGLSEDHVFWADTAGLAETGEDRCAAGDLDALVACAEPACGGKPDEEQTLCVQDECMDVLRATFLKNAACVSCLGASAGKSIADIRATCESPMGASRIYGGNNGVMLASRLPLLNKEYVFLPSSNSNRVALFARVAVPEGPAVEIACVHISAGAAIPPSHSGYATWDEEKRAQFAIIIDKLKARAGGRPALFMGDLNVGPAAENLESVHADIWDEIVAAGFSTPTLDLGRPFCTNCPENTFHDDGDSPELIDHVLTREGKDVALDASCADPVFDEQVEVTGYDGTIVQSHLSDHYGARVLFGSRRR